MADPFGQPEPESKKIKGDDNVVLGIGRLLLILIVAWLAMGLILRLPRFVFWPSFKGFFFATWWFWLFCILLPLAESAWLFWRQELWKHSSEFEPILLELRMPREVTKSPKAMEQTLMAIHSLRNYAGDTREIWWDGELTRWLTLEIASFGGETHFYIRVYKKQRGLYEAAFFAYYPDVEIVEVDDYTDRFPENVHTMKDQGYNLWGAELKLAREEAYPIRSYLSFESPDENKQYDPITTFLEALGKLEKEQMVGIQISLAPLAPTWRDKWEDLIEELRSKAQLKKKDAQAQVGTVTQFPGGILPAFEVKAGKNERDPFASFMRTPGEADTLKAVEANLAKPAFKTLIRFIYFSPLETFYDSFPRRGILGAFNQYAALDLNYFGVNYAKGTRTKMWNFPYIFPNLRNEYKKQRILHEFKTREVPHETFIGKFITSYFWDWNTKSAMYAMTTESVATLFHPPTFLSLTAPHMKRMESKKAGPPAGLAIFGGEKEIEKYQ